MEFMAGEGLPAVVPAVVSSRWRDVLRALFQGGPASHRQLAEAFGVTPVAINNHLLELRQQGLICEHRKRISGRGRPTVFWCLERCANLVVGAFLCPPLLLLGASDLVAEDLLLEDSLAVAGGDGDALADALAEFTAQAGQVAADRGGRLLQIHCALPGAIDRRGTIAHSVHHPEWTGLDLERAMAARGIGVYCDSYLYAHYFGKVEDDRNRTVMALFWDHGVAMTLGCNRRLLETQENPGSRVRGMWDIGHLLVEPDGAPCRCGHRGCLEALVGGAALAGRHSPGAGDAGTDAFVQSLCSGDAAALALGREAATVLGETLGWVVALWGVESIVVSGAVALAFPLLEADFRAGLARRLRPGHLRALELRVVTDYRRQMVLGACRTACESFFDREHFLSGRGLTTPLSNAIQEKPAAAAEGTAA